VENKEKKKEIEIKLFILKFLTYESTARYKPRNKKGKGGIALYIKTS
jgi:hypothetical protein